MDEREKKEYVSNKTILGWSVALVMTLGGWLFSTLISGTRENKILQDRKDSKQDIQIESNRIRFEAAKERAATEAQELKVQDKELEGRVKANERNIDRVIDRLEKE